ncbi:hypothetical protein MMK73_004874 [Providencia rettgeri]|nr:hypothetical protein [Providencia rettgeri]
METRTDILSDEEIESIRVNINSKIYKYIWAFPDRDVMRIIDFSVKNYSAENKEAILKGVFYYQSKMKEGKILAYIFDESHKKHVDEIEYQLQNFDFNNEELYYGETSASGMPLYKLLEEQQFHQTLNTRLKTIQKEHYNKLGVLFNEYKKMGKPIPTQDGEELSSADEQYKRERDSIFKKKGKELDSFHEQFELALKPIFEQIKKECDPLVKPEKKELDPVTMLEENQTKLESGSQSENKVQFEETDQFFDSILEHINGFRQKETTSGMIYSGTWTNKTCVFKGGVKTCTEKSGQF